MGWYHNGYSVVFPINGMNINGMHPVIWPWRVVLEQKKGDDWGSPRLHPPYAYIYIYKYVLYTYIIFYIYIYYIILYYIILYYILLYYIILYSIILYYIILYIYYIHIVYMLYYIYINSTTCSIVCLNQTISTCLRRSMVSLACPESRRT